MIAFHAVSESKGGTASVTYGKTYGQLYDSLVSTRGWGKLGHPSIIICCVFHPPRGYTQSLLC